MILSFISIACKLNYNDGILTKQHILNCHKVRHCKFVLRYHLSTICQRLDKFGSFFYYATGGVCVPADGVEKGECTPTTRFTRRSGCTRSRLDTSVSRRTLTAIAVRRLPLSPPVSLKFEHYKTKYIFVNGVAGFIAYH